MTNSDLSRGDGGRGRGRLRNRLGLPLRVVLFVFCTGSSCGGSFGGMGPATFIESFFFSRRNPMMMHPEDKSP